MSNASWDSFPSEWSETYSEVSGENPNRGLPPGEYRARIDAIRFEDGPHGPYIKYELIVEWPADFEGRRQFKKTFVTPYDDTRESIEKCMKQLKREMNALGMAHVAPTDLPAHAEEILDLIVEIKVEAPKSADRKFPIIYFNRNYGKAQRASAPLPKRSPGGLLF